VTSEEYTHHADWSLTVGWRRTRQKYAKAEEVVDGGGPGHMAGRSRPERDYV
jgi:hypothetical protein